MITVDELENAPEVELPKYPELKYVQYDIANDASAKARALILNEAAKAVNGLGESVRLLGARREAVTRHDSIPAQRITYWIEVNG